MYSDFLQYYLITVVFVFWFYILGFTVTKIIKVNFSDLNSGAIVNFFIGITLSIIIYSIIITKGITINLLLLLSLGFIYFEQKKHITKTINVNFKKHLNVLVEIPVVILLFYIPVILSVINSDSYPYLPVSRDMVFYSQISSFISDFGIESSKIDWRINPDETGMNPYHYFELWTNAFISEFSGLLKIKSYFFVTSIIFQFLLYRVLLVLPEIFKIKINSGIKIFSIFLVFFGDMVNIIPGFFWGVSGFYHYGLNGNLKITVAFIYFILALFSWQKGFKQITFIIFLCLSVFNFLFFPITLVSIPIFLLFHKIFFSKYEKLEYIRIIVYYLLFFGLFFVVQKLSNLNTNKFAYLNNNDFISYFNDVSDFKQILKYFRKYSISNFILFFPAFVFLIPFFIWKKIQFKNSIYFFILIIIINATIASALSNFLSDSSQLFLMPLTLITHLVYYSLIFYIFFKLEGKNIYKIAFLLYCLLGLWLQGNIFSSSKNFKETYSGKYLTEIENNILKIEGGGIRYVTNHAGFTARDINSNLHSQGYYLFFYKDNLSIHTVNMHLTPEKDDYFNYNKDRISQQLYYNYYLKKNNLDTLSYENCQLEFIKNHNINFIIVVKKIEVPEKILNLVVKTIEDEKNGERLMIIDRTKLN